MVGAERLVVYGAAGSLSTTPYRHQVCLMQGIGICSLCTNKTFFFGYKVGDFGDATNWPTPGEIAHKSVQVRTQNHSNEQDKALADLPVLLEALAELRPFGVLSVSAEAARNSVQGISF